MPCYPKGEHQWTYLHGCVNRYANVAFTTFAQVLPLSFQTFASHLRLANLVQIHFFVQNSCFITEYQNLWFIFYFICFYFISSLCVLTKANFNSSLHKSTQYTFNSWAKTSSCQCCFRCQLDQGDSSRLLKKRAENQRIVSNNETPTNTDFAKDNKLRPWYIVIATN